MPMSIHPCYAAGFAPHGSTLASNQEPGTGSIGFGYVTYSNIDALKRLQRLTSLGALLELAWSDPRMGAFILEEACQRLGEASPMSAAASPAASVHGHWPGQKDDSAMPPQIVEVDGASASTAAQGVGLILWAPGAAASHWCCH